MPPNILEQRKNRIHGESDNANGFCSRRISKKGIDEKTPMLWTLHTEFEDQEDDELVTLESLNRDFSVDTHAYKFVFEYKPELFSTRNL